MGTGAANQIANWLSEIFLSVFNNTTPLPVESGMNFNPPLVATDNPTQGWIDITIQNAPVANITASGALPSGYPMLNVPVDVNGTSIALSMPATSADGNSVAVFDVSLTLGSTHTCTLSDPNGYTIQDPDTLARASSYVMNQAGRNLSWTRMTCTRTSTTYWAAD